MTQKVFDLETNGLREEVTTLHCNTIQDVGSQELRSYHDSDIVPVEQGSSQKGLQELSEASELIGHNIINYDLPVLDKLFNWNPDESVKITDTLVMSRLFNPDRRLPHGFTGKGGPHSLEAWGYRIGKFKPEHEDWTMFSSAMLRRNREDVGINTITFNLLQEEAKGHNWSESLRIEHEVARIITQQEINGVAFDMNKAVNLLIELHDKIGEIDATLHKELPISYKQKGASIKEPFLRSGAYRKSVRDWYGDDRLNMASLVGGPFSRVEEKKMNIQSHPQVKKYLLSTGWVPTEWNYKDGERTSPKLTEDSFDTISGNLGELIKLRHLYSHRRSQIQGWVDSVRSDGRITAGANTCGTNTGRFRHYGVVNVPKASNDIVYGKEMRSLFICSPGRRMVGHDASGLELRMLAHYMDDEEYTDALINGDIHSVNQQAAALPTRDNAKTFIYGFLYGAGNEKVGQIVNGSAEDGAALKRKFLKGLPALDRLIKRVKQASKKGYLKGLDGRKVWMRRQDGQVMEHKALNTLLQSAGAIVMKQSMILLDKWVREEQLDVVKVIDMHDEAQADVAEKDVERYMELAELSIVEAGKYFNLKCPLDAEAKVGDNWAETH